MNKNEFDNLKDIGKIHNPWCPTYYVGSKRLGSLNAFIVYTLNKQKSKGNARNIVLNNKRC